MASRYLHYDETGKTLKLMVRRVSDYQVWNGAAFEVFANLNIATYGVTMTETPVSSYWYAATFPALSAGDYLLTYFRVAGASLALADLEIGNEIASWTGTAFVEVTGDAFARLGAPAGVSVSADLAAVKAETALIVADTNELQTDWHDGGRLDLILDGRMATFTLPTNFSALGINVSGHISRVTLTDTVTAYTGNTPQTGDSFILANGASGFVAIKGDTAAILVDTGTAGVVLADSAISAAKFAAGAITAPAIANAAIDNATFAADVGSTVYASNLIALACAKAIGALLPTVGLGSVTVDHANGWTKVGLASMTYLTTGDIGIDDATVEAFLQSDWTAGNRTTAYLKGTATTDVNGQWIVPMQLDPSTYAFKFYKDGAYGPDIEQNVIVA
jgi:hypothetical protein